MKTIPVVVRRSPTAEREQRRPVRARSDPLAAIALALSWLAIGLAAAVVLFVLCGPVIGSIWRLVADGSASGR